jgi:hypothetical protein
MDFKISEEAVEIKLQNSQALAQPQSLSLCQIQIMQPPFFH